jgi:hypothetical protein
MAKQIKWRARGEHHSAGTVEGCTTRFAVHYLFDFVLRRKNPSKPRRTWGVYVDGKFVAKEFTRKDAQKRAEDFVPARTSGQDKES